jgi:hypothetical protein
MARGSPPPRPAPLLPADNGLPAEMPWAIRALLVGMLAVAVISVGVMIWLHAVRGAVGACP